MHTDPSRSTPVHLLAATPDDRPSGGCSRVRVPLMIGRTVGDARDAADAAGAEVVVQQQAAPSVEDVVSAQLPFPGGRLRSGARIWIWTGDTPGAGRPR